MPIAEQLGTPEHLIAVTPSDFARELADRLRELVKAASVALLRVLSGNRVEHQASMAIWGAAG